MVMASRGPGEGTFIIAAAIELQDVSRRFGDREALSHLSLTIPEGAVLGFLGPNGAGKTTTVRLMVGMLRPTGGSLRVLGLDPVRHGQAVRSRLGVVLDQVGLYDRLTAHQNLEFQARVARMPARAARARIQELLERVELWDRRNDRVSGFSRGMRQKLGLARALISAPELLILDEPTSGLDPENIVRVRELLMDLAHEGGRTIFISTHLLDEAERLCTDVAIIQSGRLMAHGAPRELESTGAPTVKLTLRGLDDTRAVEGIALPPGITLTRVNGEEWQAVLPNADAVEELVAALVRAGVGVRAVAPLEESLEEAYLRVVGGGRNG